MFPGPMRSWNRIWSLAAAAAMLLFACAKPVPKVKYESQAEEDYVLGVAELEGRDFADAQRMLERVRTKYPYSKYGALAELRLADLRFAQGKYVEAADAYLAFVKIHPSSPEVDYAAFRAALSRWEDAPTDFFLFPPVYERDLAQVAKAADGLAQFVEKYPTSKYVKDAEEKLVKAKGILADRDWYVFEFNKSRGRWQGAAFRLERMMRDFPGDRREPQALYELAGMYVKLSERYKAQQALQQLIVKYPASKQRQSAEKLLAELRAEPKPQPAYTFPPAK
jgi:outer membrane protein assembly factor BamD